MFINRLLLAVLFALSFNTQILFAIEKPQNPFEKPKIQNKETINNTSIDNPTNNSNKPSNKIKISTDTKIKKEEFYNPKTITIATNYANNSVGKVICSLVNYNQHITGFDCITKQTSGSIENMNKLEKGEVDFAIVPASMIFDKIQNQDDENDKFSKNYRFVLSLEAEVLNLMVNKYSKITSIDDIKGTIIDVGSKNSESYTFLQKILKQKKWTDNDFSGIEYLKFSDKTDALCSNKVNASFIYGGIPDTRVSNITNFCEIRFISIDDELIEKISSSNYFINKEIIPGEFYLGNPIEINTLGSPTLIISSNNVEKLSVYNLANLIIGNLNTLSKIHPAFNISPLKKIADNQNQVPYHQGVQLLFQEKNLLQ
jgi:TRAP transporter TAXI family solute receptor